MHTPRFQLPNPDESPNSLKNQTLILRCMQDPLHVVMKDPNNFELGVLMRHVGVSLPFTVVRMIVESLRDDTPIDRGALSFVAEISKASVEEATSLVWNNGKPELTRYVVISSLPDEQESQTTESSRDFSPDRFQLTIDKTSKGEIEVALGWENGDCAESLDSLNERWKRMNALYKELGKDPLPWDLLPHASERETGSHDDEYPFQGLTMVAYPMDPDVILQDLNIEERTKREEDHEGNGNHHDHDRDDGDESDDAWGLFHGVDTGESPDSDDENETPTSTLEDEEASEYPAMPGDDLTIIDPTSRQLYSIAKLSSMPVSKELINEIMQTTREGAQLTPARFASVPADIREQICVHQRGTFILNGSMTETHRYALDEVDLNKPTMFCMNLYYQRPSSPKKEGILKSVLHWEQFSPNADVPNWDRIVDIARRRG